jgi:hypothetical protein
MTDYFEGQQSRDCTLHSFNNAFGRQIVTKDAVLARIESLVRELTHNLIEKMVPPAEIAKRVARMRNQYSSGRTFFSADVVWDTGKDLGAYKVRMPIPGFSSPYIRFGSMTPDVVARPIVVLGGDHKGNRHAIAVRGGLIYDSERYREGPRPLNKDELKRSLPDVYNGYVFLENEGAIPIVRNAIRPEW